MHCMKCGVQNDDENRFCDNCGHKLQSARRWVLPEEEPDEELDFSWMARRRGSWFKGWQRYAESWFYALVLLGGAGACAWFRVWWPLYGLLPLLLLLLLVRRI